MDSSMNMVCDWEKKGLRQKKKSETADLFQLFLFEAALEVAQHSTFNSMKLHFIWHGSSPIR